MRTGKGAFCSFAKYFYGSITFILQWLDILKCSKSLILFCWRKFLLLIHLTKREGRGNWQIKLEQKCKLMDKKWIQQIKYNELAYNWGSCCELIVVALWINIRIFIDNLWVLKVAGQIILAFGLIKSSIRFMVTVVSGTSCRICYL